MPKPSKRGQIVEATKEPLREVGYEDTRRWRLFAATSWSDPPAVACRRGLHGAAIEHEELRRPAAAYFDAVRSLVKG
jgi:hypothetical protein